MRGLYIWGISLACFALAAGTGTYYRFSLFTPLPGVLEYIRHAHSHLMFFSWVTPPLMLLIGAYLTRRGVRPRGFTATALVTAIGGLATYLPFLKSGYHLTPFAGKLLPISMVVSGMNGLVWYVFAALFVAATWGLKRDARLRLFDVSVVLMLASTLAVIALAYLGASGQIQRHVMLALVDWFLTLFADGWFGLAILGLAAAHASTRQLARTPVAALAWLLGASMLVRSVGRLARDAGGLAWGTPVESAAGAITALMWLALVTALWQVQKAPLMASGSAQDAAAAPTGATLLLRQLTLGLLLVKGLVELGATTPVLGQLLNHTSMHVFFLHAFLLGAVSFGVIYGMRSVLGRGAFAGATWFVAAVGVMVAALLPLTPLWPTAWGGVWILRVAAYTSIGPVLVVLHAFMRLVLGSSRSDSQQQAG